MQETTALTQIRKDEQQQHGIKSANASAHAVFKQKLQLQVGAHGKDMAKLRAVDARKRAPALHVSQTEDQLLKQTPAVRDMVKQEARIVKEKTNVNAQSLLLRANFGTDSRCNSIQQFILSDHEFKTSLDGTH